MRLENLLALTQGSLKSTPAITATDGICFDAKKVKRGNLFIALDPKDINEAVLNGAYAVVFDKPTQILDSEIAWIKVDDAELALKRVLRFHLIEKDLRVYECDPITLKLALQVMTPNTFVVVHGSLYNVAHQLFDIDSKSTVLFAPTLIGNEIFTSAQSIPTTGYESINIIEQTLFETSFIYANKFYERQLLSPFFIPYLERLLHLFKIIKLEYRLKQFTPIAHFEAVFTNARFDVQDFGASDRVLIFEPDFELITQQIDFLKRQASWAKIIYVVPWQKKQLLNNAENIFTYAHPQDIIELLKNSDFHFALIAEQDKSLLELLSVSQSHQQLTLDF